jgi:hypothetical protein
MKETQQKVIRSYALFTAAIITVCLAGCAGGGGNTKSLVVADPGNNRVLLYTQPNHTNQGAAVVLGQPDTASNTANNGGVSASTMSYPSGVAQGTKHELIVVEEGNCRVLIFQPPFTTGMSATTILGQPDEGTANCVGGSAASSSGLYFPTGAAMDSHGNLWVADQSNSRVVEYQPPFTPGMAAAVALGQTATDGASGTYDCNQAGGGAPHGKGGPPPTPTAGMLCYPSRLAFDSTGDLWVVDAYNNRVLMYPPEELKQGGMATVVLGQQNFLSDGYGTSETTLYHPWDLAFDSDGNLWLSDYLNERVLKYQPPFTTGMVASEVLGQSDFATATGGTSATKFNGPTGVAIDFSGNLAVTDLYNNRTLLFPPAEQVTGGSATVVLGQQDLNSGSKNQAGSTSAVSEWLPQGVVAHR